MGGTETRMMLGHGWGGTRMGLRMGTHWAELDGAGLDWTRLDWAGLGQTGLEWAGLESCELLGLGEIGHE